MPLVPDFSEKTLRGARARWLMAFGLLLIGSCFLRVVYLQIIRGHAFAQASESNHTQIVVERAPRGRILDRNGEVLADDQPVFVALFSPLGLNPLDFQQVLERLAPIMAVSAPELEHRLFAARRTKSMVR